MKKLRRKIYKMKLKHSSDMTFSPEMVWAYNLALKQVLKEIKKELRNELR